MTIQLFDQISSDFEQAGMTPQERWFIYVKAFESLDPTEGVPQPLPGLHWPKAPRWEDVTGDPEDEDDVRPDPASYALGSASVLNIDIPLQYYRVIFGTDSSAWLVRPAESDDRLEGFGQTKKFKGVAKKKGAAADPPIPVEVPGVLEGFESDDKVEDVTMEDGDDTIDHIEEVAAPIEASGPAAVVEDDVGADDVRESVEKAAETHVSETEDVQMDESVDLRRHS